VRAFAGAMPWRQLILGVVELEHHACLLIVFADVFDGLGLQPGRFRAEPVPAQAKDGEVILKT
jgi:hypothetical protein